MKNWRIDGERRQQDRDILNQWRVQDFRIGLTTKFFLQANKEGSCEQIVKKLFMLKAKKKVLDSIFYSRQLCIISSF